MQVIPEDNLKKLNLAVGMIDDKSTNITSEEMLLRKIEKLYFFILANWNKLVIRCHSDTWNKEYFVFDLTNCSFSFKHISNSTKRSFQVIVKTASFYIKSFNASSEALTFQRALHSQMINLQELNELLEEMEDSICDRLCHKSLKEIDCKD